MNNDFDYINQSDFNTPQPQYVTYIPYGLTPKTFEERKNIKKIANIIGGALLIMLAVSDIVVVGLRLILGALGLLGNEGASVIFNSSSFKSFLQAMLSITMFTLPFIFLFKVNGYRISSIVKLKKPKREDILPYLLFGVGACYFANFAVSFAGRFFESFGIDYNVSSGEKPEGILGFMLTFLKIAVVPPLVEEFACRGIILGSLRKYGDGFAVVASAILFGVMHGNFTQIPFAFLVGLSLGFITVKTNTIWIAVAVHAVNNGISVILDYVTNAVSETAAGIISISVLTACSLLFAISLLLFKDNKDVFTLKKSKCESTNKQRYKWFFATPTMIIFIVLCFIESLQFFD